MVKIISLSLAVIFLSATQSFGQEISYERNADNPLFKACSAENVKSGSPEECKKTYIRQAIETCYDANKKINILRSCEGKGRAICNVVSEFSSTLSINYCAKEALQVWEDILKIEYEEFLDWAQNKDETEPDKNFSIEGSHSFVEQLEVSQSDWVDYRRSKCALVLRLYYEGTARAAYTFNCKIKTTVERIDDLNTQRRFL